VKNYKKIDGSSFIELVVVIAIIGVLISMLVPTITKSHHSIKLTQSKLRIAQIANGLKSYYTEYGCWPDILKPNVAHSFVDKSEIFASMLVGKSNYVDIFQQQNLLYLNPKQLKFIDITEDDLYMQNSVVQKDRLADRFNNPAIYVIFADPELASGRIPQAAFDLYPSIRVKIPEDGLNESVAVFSYAQGKEVHPGVRKDAVDVLSWD
jgi:type II secretory pathway pseudopilin PulG